MGVRLPVKKQPKFKLGDRVRCRAVFIGEVAGIGEVINARVSNGYVTVRLEGSGLASQVQVSRLELVEKEKD